MMSAVQLTAHAAKRMAQRGLADDDVLFIQWIGTEVEGGYFFREKDFQALDRELKRLRDQAKRLVGKRLVLEGDRLITAYHAGRSKQRLLLRDIHARPLMEKHS